MPADFASGTGLARHGLRANLAAYSISVAGLAAVLPASARMLPERLTTLGPRALRAFAAGIGSRDG